MVKRSLTIYRDNIYHFFTVLGFVALGLIIAISIFIPNMKTLINNSTTDFVNLSHKYSFELNTNEFSHSLIDQFKAIDWKNPIKALEHLFSGDALKHIFEIALEKGGISQDVIKAASEEIVEITNVSITLTMNQIRLMVLIVSICAFIGFIFVRIMVQHKTVKEINLFRFILSLVLDIIVVAISWFLISLSIKNINNGWVYLANFGIIVFHAVLTLFISFITYGNKGSKLKDVFSFDILIGTIVCDSIVIVISSLIVGIIFVFNDLMAVLIGVPLMIVTTIIIDVSTNVFIKDLKTLEV